MRVSVPLTKPIDLAQLDAELGGFGLAASETEVVAVEGSPVTVEDLTAAVEAHEPSATPEPTIADLVERVAALEEQVTATQMLMSEAIVITEPS